MIRRWRPGRGRNRRMSLKLIVSNAIAADSRIQSHRGDFESGSRHFSSRRQLIAVRKVREAERREKFINLAPQFALSGKVKQQDQSRIGAQGLGGAAEDLKFPVLHVDLDHIDVL